MLPVQAFHTRAAHAERLFYGRGVQLSGSKLKEILRGHLDKLRKRDALGESSKEQQCEGVSMGPFDLNAPAALIQTYEVLIDAIHDDATFDFSFGEVWELVAMGILPR